MTAVDALVCERCGRRYPADEPVATCSDHGEADGRLDVSYDEATVAEVLEDVDGGTPPSLWAYEPVLPTAGERVDLGAGGTPLLPAPTLGARYGVDLSLKDERTNPTGSMKDRASAVLASRGRAAEATLACASTGNAAGSIAAYAARAGLDCRIFVPEDVPEGKAVQPSVHGAAVTAVPGTYADAVERCRERAAGDGWLDCSAGVTPYGLEGLRTVGFELAAASAPDWVVVPMGNGCGLAALWKGLVTSVDHGHLADPPSLLGVQAEGASAIHDRFTGEKGPASGTAADSIDVDRPHSADRACHALEASGGASVAVSDDAILDAEAELARTEGIYAEPASAATLAGLASARADGIVDGGAAVTLLITGSGLKDTESARAVVDREG